MDVKRYDHKSSSWPANREIQLQVVVRWAADFVMMKTYKINSTRLMLYLSSTANVTSVVKLIPSDCF